MLRALPAGRLPAVLLERKPCGLSVSAGFLMGAPADSYEAGPLYRGFGSSEGRYFYLGLFHSNGRQGND